MTKTSREGRSSIYDVARLAGVSPATVSKFLHGARTIKPKNVANIEAAIEELGYRLDPLASDLRRDKRKIIGLVVPDLESEFFGALASRLELMAENAGYSLSIGSSHESQVREEALIERMGDWRVAGTILAPVRSERGLGASKMHEIGMTGVLIDRVEKSDHFNTVSVDNYGASAAICRELGELGHKKVLLIGLSEVSKNVRSRVTGFKQQAEQNFPNMQVDVLISDGRVDQLRLDVAERLEQDRPTAVFSLFQKGTLIALSEFRSLGIKCPDDIDLVGFDDAEWMQVTEPTVSAVVQPLDRIAAKAFERLVAQIEGKSLTSPSLHLENCELAIRDSMSSPRRLSIPRAELISEH